MSSLWNRPGNAPKPRFDKNDTSAAIARLVELRRKESLPVPRELVDSPEAVEARWRSKHPDEHVPIGEVLPYKPAASAKRPVERPLPALVDGCRFPIGDTPPFLFCNAARVLGKPYCECHMKATTRRVR
jgi:hypothetical protein